MCESLHTAGMSSRRPCHSTRPSACHARSRASGTAAGLPSSGAPTRVKRRAGCCARTARAASTNSPTALVPQHPRDQRYPDRPLRLGLGRETGRVDAGAGDDDDALPIDAQPRDECRIVLVLGQAGALPAVQRPAKPPAQQRAQQPRPDVAGREDVAEARQRADGYRDPGEPRRRGAVQNRLHRDVVDDGRPLGPIEAPQRGERTRIRQRRDAAALHRDGQNPHPFRADSVAMSRHRAGDGHGKAGIPRRPRDRHPVRTEIAIVADHEQQSGWALVPSCIACSGRHARIGHGEIAGPAPSPGPAGGRPMLT